MVETFELVFICQEKMSDIEFEKKLNKYEQIIENLPGKIISIENMGKKHLAYEMRSNKDGWYAVFTFETDIRNIASLERWVRIDDDVLKFITVKMGEEDTETKRNSQAAKDYMNRKNKNKNKKPILDCLAVMLGEKNYFK